MPTGYWVFTDSVCLEKNLNFSAIILHFRYLFYQVIAVTEDSDSSQEFFCLLQGIKFLCPGVLDQL